MKYHKQLLKHDPENRVFGDCQRTVIACLLDLHPLEVPHFGEDYENAEQFNARLDAYLESRGLVRQLTIYNCSLEDLLRTQKNTNPGLYYMLGGVSAIGAGHVVIGLDDAIHWDPSPAETGAVMKPFEDGLYHVEYLVPSFLKHKAESAPAS